MTATAQIVFGVAIVVAMLALGVAAFHIGRALGRREGLEQALAAFNRAEEKGAER